MSEPKRQFVYVTYINATIDKVFGALQDPEMTRLYWGNHRNECDWKPGSTFEHKDYNNDAIVDIVGHVMEIDPPRKLTLSWVAPEDMDNPERHTRVTFEVALFAGTSRLTITHDRITPGPMLNVISAAWPAIVSSLKTLLETGKPLNMTAKRWPTNPQG